MAKAKPLWHSMTVEEIEQGFRSNIHVGLSNEEAARRRHKGEALSMFPELSAKDAIKLVMSDVATYYIAIIAMLCLVFQRWLEAIVVLIIIAINSILTAFLKVVSNKYENAVTAPTLPRCDVLRDNKLISVDARSVVEGDIIFMKAGDILPCDVRLIKQDKLLVYEKTKNSKDETVYNTSPKTVDPISSDQVIRSGRIGNMVMAGSIINGGMGKGIVVACGSNTEFTVQDRDLNHRFVNGISEIDDKINKLFRYITIGLLVMLIPFIFVALFSKDSSASPIDFITQIGAIAASLPMQTVTVLYSTVICVVVKYCSLKKNGDPQATATITKYVTADKLSEIKKLFLVGRKSVTGKGICVNHVYTAFHDTTDPERCENPTDVKSTLEYAFLVNSACIQVTGNNNSALKWDGVLRSELDEYGISLNELTSGYTLISHKILGAEECADVAMVSKGSDFKNRTFLICRSLDRRIIDCAQWYSENGVAIMISDHLRERLIENYNRYKSLGYEVISIAKTTAQLYDKSSFGEFEDQIVFEGMVAIGNVYGRDNSESALELKKLGISPVVCLKSESADSYYIVKNLFKDIKSDPYIVFASALKENGESLMDHLDADAYLGFDENVICGLISANQSQGINCASVLTDFAHLKIAGRSGYVIACTYDAFEDNACAVPYPSIADNTNASCSITLRHADLLVSPVTRGGGGLNGVLTAVKRVRPFLANLRSVVSYLLFSLCMRTTAVYLPLLFGRQAMNPAMTLYLGCIVDLLAVIAIALNPTDGNNKRSDKAYFNSIASILRGNLKPFITAFLCGALIFAAGMMIPRTAVLESQSFTFLALFLAQVIKIVFDIVKNGEKMTKTRFVFIIVTVCLILLVTLIFGLIPGIRTTIGLCGGITAYFRAFIITVITSALIFLDYKAYKKE